jgi:hypothetical protein
VKSNEHFNPSFLTTTQRKSLFATHLAPFIPVKSTKHYYHTLLRKSFSNFQQEEAEEEEEEKKETFPIT